MAAEEATDPEACSASKRIRIRDSDSDSDEDAPTSSPTISPHPTSSPTTRTNILAVGLTMTYVIGCILFGIIFCECVFDKDLCENENELKCKYKFKNVNGDFNFYDYGDLCHGLLHPPPITPRNNPTRAPSHPVSIDFFDSRAPLREQFDFVYLVDSAGNGNNIIDDNMSEINNENFYDKRYYATTTPASLTGLRENDILEYIFNIVCNGIGFYCDVNNGM